MLRPRSPHLTPLKIIRVNIRDEGDMRGIGFGMNGKTSPLPTVATFDSHFSQTGFILH